MALLNRLSLPQNFTDQVSGKMLTAPVPEFFFDKLLNLAGVRSSLEDLTPADMSISPERGPSAGGAQPAPLADLQLMLNDQSGQSEVFMVSTDCMPAPGVGQTVRFLRPSFTGNSYTIAARRTASGTQISTTPLNLGTESTYLTCERLNGPHDGTAIAPYGIDRRDSKRSVVSLVGLAAQAMAYDRAKLVDTIHVAAVDAIIASTGGTYVVPGRGRRTLNTQLTSPGSGEMDLETLLRAKRTLKNRSVPTFNGKYMAVLRTEQAAQLQLDNDYRELAKTGQSDQSKNPLYGKGFIGEVANIMIYESSTLTQDTSTVSGNTINQGIMLGREVFGYGIAEPVNVAFSTADNYGNQSLIIWQSEEAFGILNNTYGVGLLSD